MTYVEQALLPGERVVHRGLIHWSIYAMPAFWFGLGIVFPLYAALIEPTKLGSAVIGSFLLFLLATLFLLHSVLVRRTTELAVTTRRIIAKSGIVRRHTVELNHNKLESVHVDQSLMGRLLGFGTLIINGTGGGKTPIPRVGDPLGFRRRTMEVVDAERSPVAVIN
jgi:uncharacterized membrane protein YdbT with pleckstrin-like domain